MTDPTRGGGIIAKVAAGVLDVPAADWDACAGRGNPFVGHAFLAALETSGSVGAGTGWQPAPILVEDADGKTAGAMPAYVKGHSQGEYVFDHSWADSAQGGDITPSCRSQHLSRRFRARASSHRIWPPRTI